MHMIALFTALFSFNLFAQGPHACAGDVQKFCQGVPKTRQALDACLDKHESELGPSCKETRKKFAEQVRQKNKCFDDAQKFCGAAKNTKEINECLKKNQSKLSKACIAQKDERQKKALPCKEDMEKFCSESKRGKTSIEKCMLDNADKLSGSCKEARAKFEEKLLKRQPCFNDAIKFCDTKKKDPAALEACLSENESSLSKKCSETRKKIADKISARNPCYQDALKLCPKERFKPELLRACLAKNESKLSKLCQDTRQMAERKQKNIKDSCGGDEKKFCSSVPKKGGAVMACLKANLGRISFQCKKAITD